MGERGETPPSVGSTDAMRAEFDRLALRRAPSFVTLRAQLPVQGRTNQVLAATQHLSIVLKTYASGGENELHAHTNEDHAFIILQGSADFFGPKGEARRVGRNECVLLPAGNLYRFVAVEDDDPLVMVRVGAVVEADRDVFARIGEDGEPMDAHSEKNKETVLVLGDRWFE